VDRVLIIFKGPTSTLSDQKKQALQQMDQNCIFNIHVVIQ